MDVLTLSIVKKYVKETLVGMGALKGAPCQVGSIQETADGLQVIFEWTDSTGVSHSSVALVPKGETGPQGPRGPQGERGQDGRGITSITKIETQGNVDTYQVLYTDGTYTTFQVVNGEGAGLPLTGGTLTGALILSGDPALPNEAVTKNYVDTKIASLSGGANFIHHQEVPSAQWDIQHNLGKYCQITIVDDERNVVYPDIQYLSQNQIEVDATVAFSGYAFCN